MTTSFLGDDNAPIRVVEYHGRHVHSVVTQKSTYDFNWCRSNGTAYWHMSGGGFQSDHHHVEQMAFPGNPPTSRVWAAPGVKLVYADRYDRVSHKPTRTLAVTDALAARLGWRIMRRQPRNPFEGACGDERCTWCDKCGDFLLEDSDTLCEHLSFCGDCGEYIEPGSCKHMIHCADCDCFDTPEFHRGHELQPTLYERRREIEVLRLILHGPRAIRRKSEVAKELAQ